MIIKTMPNTIVIPTFGNNDFDLDDEPPVEDRKHEFYDRIFKMWFLDHPKNSLYFNLSKTNYTFRKGGYYRVDISPKLSILALNTVMYLFKNKGMEFQGTQLSDQLDWIETNLWHSEPERKFILTCHVYFGVKYEGTLKP